MPVFSQALLALVGGHLVSFSFFSAWHTSPKISGTSKA
jgi:hypothetical protein